LKLRDDKADEVVVFQCTNGYTEEDGLVFFQNLFNRV
jgi:hypothetical protein